MHALEETHRPVLLHDLPSCLPEIAVFYAFAVGAHTLTSLHQQVRRALRAHLHLRMGLSLPPENVADHHLIASIVSTTLRVELCLDYIERGRGNGSNGSSDSTAEVVLEPMVSILHSEVVFESLIESYNKGSEGDVHGVVDREAAVESKRSLPF